MIKTLRITTIVAALLAVVFFIFSVVYGVRKDPAIEEFLSSPTVLEKFAKDTQRKPQRKASQLSPLVKQAQAFALYLNPPPPPKPARPASPVASVPKPSIPRPRGTVSAKFKLIGTSVNESKPEFSLAFIDEPGKGLHWVRQSSKIDHLIIEQIKDGIVVVRDGQRTFEVATENRPTTPRLLDTGDDSPAATTSPITSTSSTSTRPRATVVTTRPPRPSTGASASTPKVSTSMPTAQDENAALAALMEKLKKLHQQGPSGQGDAPAAAREAEALEKLISTLTGSRVSAEEAQKLDDLGKQLNERQQDSNQLGRPDSSDNAPPRYAPPRPTRRYLPNRRR